MVYLQNKIILKREAATKAEKDHKALNREQRQLRLAIALMMEGTQNLKIPGDGSE